MARKKSERKLVRHQHYLFEDQIQELARRHEKTGIPASRAIRDALDQYLQAKRK